jgi:hypothetical protein
VGELAHAERPGRAARSGGRRRAGRAARVDGKRLFVITSVAAALGLMMIVLKDVVLIHLH